MLCWEFRLYPECLETSAIFFTIEEWAIVSFGYFWYAMCCEYFIQFLDNRRRFGKANYFHFRKSWISIDSGQYIFPRRQRTIKSRCTTSEGPLGIRVFGIGIPEFPIVFCTSLSMIRNQIFSRGRAVYSVSSMWHSRAMSIALFCNEGGITIRVPLSTTPFDVTVNSSLTALQGFTMSWSHWFNHIAALTLCSALSLSVASIISCIVILLGTLFNWSDKVDALFCHWLLSGTCLSWMSRKVISRVCISRSIHRGCSRSTHRSTRADDLAFLFP